ncbi:hypothetical protein ACSI5F_03745 [Ralstonia pseudosolanacearum]|uniref:hypothetical protein n=1 Tax=Ralstonia pseudosolanacearum TaxID=1310165 RepID=UPI003EDEC7E8
MTQGQLNQLFQRANRTAIATKSAADACQMFGDDTVAVMVEGADVRWHLNERRIAWDRLQSMCDDY